MKTKIYRLFVVIAIAMVALTACGKYDTDMLNGAEGPVQKSYQVADCVRKAGDNVEAAKACLNH